MELLRLSNLQDEVELADRLGRGAYGEVFKGTRKGDRADYAVKVMKKRKIDQDSIMREVDVLKKLSGHPGVVKLVDSFQTPKEYVLVMELLQGGELFDYLIEKEYLSEKDATCYVWELLEIINYLHQQQICHLDLKPENIILVDPEKHKIKLIDFGCARDLSLQGEVSTLVGTAEFQAPEAINYDPVTTAVDMWSSGVITYIMLSGISPFLGDTDAETCQNVSVGEYDYDEEFPAVSKDAKDFIDGLLIRNPRKRFKADQALKHKWLEMSSSVESNIIATGRLKQYRARRRLKAALHTVRITCALAKLMQGAQCKTPPPLGDDAALKQ